MLFPLTLAFATAAVASLLLVPVARAFGRRGGLYAKPTADRWHRRPVPKTGGPALLAALLVAVTVSGHAATLWPLLLVSGAMCGIGLVDDLRPIGPAAKLIGQLLAAGLLLYLAPAIRITGGPVIDLLLALLWVVGITNAFNLLDNIDGLAAGVTAIAGMFLVAALHNDGGPALEPLAIAAAAIAGVSLGFLAYNFQPATIFMGDSGSQFFGSFVAGLALLATPGMKAHVIPVAIIPVVILLIPIFDTAFVTFTRGLAGRSAFVGGRDHTSHRLVALGIGERRAVLVLYVLAALGGFVALGLQMFTATTAAGLIAGYVVVLGATGVYLGHIEATHPDEEPPITMLPTELTSRYRVYEIALDTVLIGLAYYVAFVIRFRGPEAAQFLPYFSRSLPIVVCVQLAALWVSGKYRQVWASLGPTELMNLLWGLGTGAGASVIAVLYLYHFEGYSRSVFAFDAVLLAAMVVGTRVGLGALDDYLRRRRSRGRTALVYGAGRGGTLVIRELMQNADLDLRPIGFVDDDASKRRLRVDGIPVLGTVDTLDALLAQTAPSTVVISIRDLSPEKFDRVVAICASRDVEVRRMRFGFDDVARIPPRGGVVRFPKA